jgi:hypothetical protein
MSMGNERDINEIRHSQHLVCYYSKADVLMERLPIIRYMPHCQELAISSDLVVHQNFRKTSKEEFEDDACMSDFSREMLFNDSEFDQLMRQCVHQPVRKRQRTLTAPASFYSADDMMFDMSSMMMPSLEASELLQDFKDLDVSALLPLDSQTLSSLLPPRTSPMMDSDVVSPSTFASGDCSFDPIESDLSEPLLSSGDHLLIDSLEKQNDPMTFIVSDYLLGECMLSNGVLSE